MTRIIVASKRPIWIALILSMLIHTGLISVQAGHRIDTSFLRAWILDSLAPMEKLVDRSLSGVAYIWGNYFALIGLHQENESLRTQIQTLQMRLDREREEVLEAKRLRELLSIQNPELGKSVVARVIGSDPAHGNQTVTIDKGLSHGVKPDSAVITPNGIVGRVIHSSNFFSIVQLILDAQSGIGVLLESTRRQGIIRGTGGRDLELDYIDDDSDLKEGDAFITSGLDRIYPKGLRVGVIASVGPRRGLFKSVQIRPAADFGRLEEVLCFIDPPQNVDAIDPTQAPPSP
jgi:rod shape-determining protein MreC